MGVVYNCLPNSHSYDYLIHGLCAQDRTNNARKLCNEMKGKGFVPSKVDEAVNYLWEMTEKQRSADFITYQTVLDQICRQGRTQDAMSLLKELQVKDLLDGHTYQKLLSLLEQEFGKLNNQNQFRH
uniref:Pentatricopeptide repeat-containing protein, mitochondrial n=1 Tax=Vitis vinifera TaxID=29760 RepID=A5B508_VITVI|nr:hypothetical protein VITISV_018476 [Vitis vinifera]